MHYALFFLCILSPLVFFHELGHYLVARWFGSAIDRFSVGFGPVLLKRKDRRGTEWALSLLPIGGYVKMQDTPSDPETIIVGKPYPSLARWQRALVLIAGPMANLVLGVVLLGLSFGIQGIPSTPPIVASVTPGGVAALAGIQTGDTLTTVGNNKIHTFNDVVQAFSLNLGSPVEVAYTRAGMSHTVVLTPHHVIQTNAYGRHFDQGLVGIRSFPPTTRHIAWINIPSFALHQSMVAIKTNLIGLWQMISGQRSPQALQGVIGMAQTSASIGTNVGVALYFAAMISINLMLVNLLPVATVLDGGQLFLLAIEGLVRRDLPNAIKNGFATASMGLILGLMLYTTLQDLWFLHPHSGT